MAATVTLASTTLTNPISGTESELKVTSTSGMLPGLRLFIGGEVMTVVRLLVDPWVKVNRGVDGTSASPHLDASTVYIARADQLYTSDPQGDPPGVVAVAPWINVINGAVWFAQGDEFPTAAGFRWWQKQTTTYDTTGLGARTATPTPTTSL